MDELFGAARWDAWRALLVDWGWRAVVAGVAILVGFWVARRVSGLVRRGIEHRADDRTLATFLENLAYFGLVLVFIVGGLDFAGVPTASLLAAMGAAGLALGLALKDSLANVAAGVLLIVTRPFHVGDVIEAAGRVGTVLEIKLMQTRMLTADNAEMTLPNGIVMGAAVVNFTARPERRIEVTLVLAHDADAGRALAIARDVLDAHAVVDRTRPREALLSRVGPQGIELTARAWIRTAELATAPSAILGDLRAALHDAGIAGPAVQGAPFAPPGRPA